MSLDKNEKRLIEKLTEALILLNADRKDIETILHAKKIDRNFLGKAGKLFDETEACDVCGHAFHTWRRILDDETVLSFIDDWINWKKKNPTHTKGARVVKMKKRS
jgi:hypothetical protein